MRSLLSLSFLLDSQHQAALFAHNAAIAVNVTDGRILHLALATATHQLPHSFDHVAHTTSQTRLAKRKLPPVGIARKIAFVRKVMLLHKPAAFALLAETGIFQGDKYGDGVSVIRLNKVHIFRRD